MIAARLRRQFQIGAKKCCAKFCNKLLAGVAFITPTLPP
jgi:hypothetical protein